MRRFGKQKKIREGRLKRRKSRRRAKKEEREGERVR
jgi:hypothetical protein